MLTVKKQIKGNIESFTSVIAHLLSLEIERGFSSGVWASLAPPPTPPSSIGFPLLSRNVNWVARTKTPWFSSHWKQGTLKQSLKNRKEERLYRKVCWAFDGAIVFAFGLVKNNSNPLSRGKSSHSNICYGSPAVLSLQLYALPNS